MPGAVLQFAPDLVPLQASLGDLMGRPAACPESDKDGDTLQGTTTGLAIYRPSGMALFASGDQHWALTATGLEAWTGSWHDGFDPPLALSPTDVPESVQSSAVDVAWVRAVTVLSVDRAAATLIIQDDTGLQYAVARGAGCPDLAAALGQSVYVRSEGAFGSPGAALVLVQQHETCPVSSVQQLTD